MENIQTPILVKILTNNKLVLSKILEFFGYAHQNVYLLHGLCLKTRKTLADIKSGLKLFFSNNRYTCFVIKDGLDSALETDDLNNQITEYIDLNIKIRMEEKISFKKLLNINRVSMVKKISMYPAFDFEVYSTDLKFDLKEIKRRSPDADIAVNL